MIVQQRVTLKDIAERVGVTPAVVSHVVNGMKSGNIRVSNARRDEILKAARQLGYVPHFNARQMAKQRSFSIGVVLIMHPETVSHEHTSLYVDYAYEAIIGVEAICREHNYNCLINIHRVDREFELPRMMRDGSVDGVVIIGPNNENILEQFSQARIECVQVGSNVPRNRGVQFVAADLKKKFREVSEACFRQHGFSRQMVCLLEGPGPGEIMEYFVDLNNSVPGLRNESLVLPECWEEENNKDIFRGILTRRDHPEVLYVDPPHIGLLLKVTEELGLSIPDDLNVITYATMSVFWKLNNTYSRRVSMITQPTEKTGRLAAQLLLKKFGDYEADVPRSIECGFINGQTCRELNLD